MEGQRDGGNVRAVVQRVSQAKVDVAGRTVGAIGQGLCVLLSVGQGDAEADLRYIVEKLAGLRIFADAEGKMNLDVTQIGGAVLLISQFTLHGDVRRGKRPGFTAAMAPDAARAWVDRCAEALRLQQIPVAQGVFGADMQVTLTNDGPVTILLDSQKTF